MEQHFKDLLKYVNHVYSGKLSLRDKNILIAAINSTANEVMQEHYKDNHEKTFNVSLYVKADDSEIYEYDHMTERYSIQSGTLPGGLKRIKFEGTIPELEQLKDELANKYIFIEKEQHEELV